MAKKKVTKKKSRSSASRTTKKRPAKKRVAKKSTAKKRPARGKSTAPAKKKPAAAKKKKIKKKKVAPKKSTERSTKKKTTKAAIKPAATSGAKKKPSSKRRTTGAVVGRKRSGSVAEAASAASADAQGYVFINGRRVRMISTKKKKEETPAKKPRKSAADSVPVEPKPIPSKPDKPIKTRLAPKTLEEYRDLLLIKRAELVGDLSAMEAEALQSGAGNLSNVPIHMADVGTDTYDQDFMLGLAEKERARLREIDEALRRIEDRTYGVCQMTGKPIPKARLLAKPWAKYTIEAAREVEGSWGS